MSSRRSKGPITAEFSQYFWFEGFEKNSSFAQRKMFGGLALYLNDRMIAVLCEDSTGTRWGNRECGYPIWNGVLIATDYVHHESLQSDLPALEMHPVLKKWLYLPLLSPQYEETIRTLLKMLTHSDPRLGIVPGTRAKRRKVTRIPLTKTAKRRRS